MTKKAIFAEIVIFIFLLLIVIGVLLESYILYKSYMDADKVNCNFIWCEFTTTRQAQIINRYCSENGKEINCSD